ncbi:hypothetical protein AVEN_129830-1 [Araneus ventricosus]|uniref:Uncharacterized protein n=1 Tax=Araneus ventricosus TaxID=182803 RepID=A0A4Y2VTT2_ARAVE|nr:hypothetical protein AVEN_129830-1 [Araneus ventricosus]
MLKVQLAQWLASPLWSREVASSIPGCVSYSVFAIICNKFARQACGKLAVQVVVTSELSLTCCKLIARLHSCHDKFVANLHSCHDKFVASLLQAKIAIWEEEHQDITSNKADTDDEDTNDTHEEQGVTVTTTTDPRHLHF